MQNPQELSMLLSQIKFDGDEQQMAKIKNYLKVIEQSLELMSDEDKEFFVQSNLYKQFIYYPPTAYQQRMPQDQLIINSPAKSLKIRNEDSDFVRKIKKLLIADIEKQRENPEQLNLVLPWARMFFYQKQEHIDHHLHHYAIKVLEQLSLKSYQFHNFSRLEQFRPDMQRELQYFSFFFQESDSVADSANEKYRLENIVQRIIEGERTLPSPVDDWMPRESQTSAAQDNLWEPLFPPVDPSYHPPETLPTPVDDWTSRH